jgi:hypothetical protein
MYKIKHLLCIIQLNKIIIQLENVQRTGSSDIC